MLMSRMAGCVVIGILQIRKGIFSVSNVCSKCFFILYSIVYN